VGFSLLDTYLNCGGKWLRANLHCHSKEHSGCASVPLSKGIQMYRDAGTRVLALTDHDHVSDLAEFSLRYPDMTFLEGFEYSRSENMLFIGEKVPPLHRLSIDEALLQADGLLTVVCHPAPRKGESYWSVEKILSLDPVPIGVEVYNGHYIHRFPMWKNTNPLYTTFWDELLSRGARIWGFANDDFHHPNDFGRAFNMICGEDRSPASVMSALKAGRFYASTGLLLSEVIVGDASITVRLAESARGSFIGPGGRVLEEGEGTLFQYAAKGEMYVRFEAEGSAGRIFLQPFFAEG